MIPQSFPAYLLAWYDAGHRDLPWRRTRDPYRIWLSEIMLQQTRVEAVIPYYERFLQTCPDVAALAAGMTLGDGLQCLPAGLEPLGDGSSCLVTLREGKYHQVKRMLAARGKPVLALKRLSMGPLCLDEELNPGEWRPLTSEETGKLKRAVELS